MATATPLQVPAPPPQAAPAPPTPVVDQAVAALQQAEAHFVTQLDVLTAQQQVLRGQLRSGNNAMRSAAANRMTDINLQSAATQVQLAQVRAELAGHGIAPAAQESQGGSTQPPAFPPQGNRGLDNDQITGIVIVFILAVMMPISLGILRRMWKGSSKPSIQPFADNISPRLERLEHATDAIALEIERISEGQRFVTKVLAERPVAVAPVAPHASARERAGESNSGGEGKPFLALGAGPIEPIRVAERQAVRQSVTPH